MRRVGVNEIGSNNKMSTQLEELTNQVELVLTKNTQNREVCGICINYGHDVNTCPFQSDYYAKL